MGPLYPLWLGGYLPLHLQTLDSISAKYEPVLTYACLCEDIPNALQAEQEGRAGPEAGLAGLESGWAGSGPGRSGLAVARTGNTVL